MAYREDVSVEDVSVKDWLLWLVDRRDEQASAGTGKAGVPRGARDTAAGAHATTTAPADAA
jgi:hypothetical protein